MKHLFKSETKETEFRGEKITLKKLDMLAMAELQKFAKTSKDVEDFTKGIQSMASMIANGVVEFGPAYKDIILRAPVDMIPDITELSTEIMDFNNLGVEAIAEGNSLETSTSNSTQ